MLEEALRTTESMVHRLSLDLRAAEAENAAAAAAAADQHNVLIEARNADVSACSLRNSLLSALRRNPLFSFPW